MFVRRDSTCFVENKVVNSSREFQLSVCRHPLLICSCEYQYQVHTGTAGMVFTEQYALFNSCFSQYQTRVPCIHMCETDIIMKLHVATRCSVGDRHKTKTNKSVIPVKNLYPSSSPIDPSRHTRPREHDESTLRSKQASRGAPAPLVGNSSNQ